MSIVIEDIVFPQQIGFYEDLNEQKARQLDCILGKGIPYPLVPSSTLFPFCVPSVGVFELVCVGSEEETELIDMTVDGGGEEDDFAYYMGDAELDIPVGVYYIKFLPLIGEILYSDWFEVFDDSLLDDRITEIAYRDSGIVGEFEYPEDYYNKIWLDGEFRKPTYVLTREAKLDGDDNPFYSQQRWEKRVAIDVAVTEPTVDALTMLPLHDTINVTIKGVTYENISDAVFDEPEWDESLTCIAKMNVSFCLKKIIKRLCGALTIPDPPEPPEPPVVTYPVSFQITSDCEGLHIIAGATISITAEGFGVTQTGNYLFNLPAGTYSYSVVVDDYVSIPDGSLIVVDEGLTECVEMTFDGAIGGEYYEKYGGYVAEIGTSSLLICASVDLNDGLKLTHGVAGTMAAYYNGGGFNDWRLPTESELQTIFPFASDFEFQEELYWTSSSISGGSASTVNMATGLANQQGINSLWYARAVRTVNI